MLDYKELNPLQINTLLDFAKGYSTIRIATKYKVCKATITNRLRRIYKKAPEEFERAIAIRRARKRVYKNLQNPMSIENCKSLKDCKSFKEYDYEQKS